MPQPAPPRTQHLAPCGAQRMSCVCYVRRELGCIRLSADFTGSCFQDVQKQGRFCTSLHGCTRGVLGNNCR